MTDERDPTLEKVWRAHSREEPPTALDQAILAAAHREVASGPRKVTPEALRPPRWWMPLAAAAAIGVVAIGLVQLSPPEQPALDTTSAARRPAEQILEEKSRVASVAQSPPAAVPAPATNEPTDALKKQKAAGEAAAPASAPRADANTNAVAPKVAPLPPPSPPESRANKRDAPAPEPFPAAKPGRKTEAMDDKRAATGEPSEAGKFAADAAAPAQRQMAAPRASVDRESGARKESQSEATVAGALATAPASAPPPPPASPAPQKLAAEKDAAAPSAMRSRAPAPVEDKVGAAGGAMSQLSKNQEPSDEARKKAQDPDAWIVRIRKLRDEGKTEDAVRELREFRALVPDAERRLPPDLRDWKP